MAEKFVFKNPKIVEQNVVLYDVREKPIDLYGLYKPEIPGVFKRIPTEVAENTSVKVSKLYTNTAGARIRFTTDSTFIAIGATYPGTVFTSPKTSALTPGAAICFDMYVDGKYSRVLYPDGIVATNSAVAFEIPDGQYEAHISFGVAKMRQITINFPTYVNVSEVYIGIKEEATLLSGQKYVNDKPVVFYGSSITQGACASHAGNIYQNILSRRLNFDYTDLGFAGSCKAEDTIIDYICTLDMCMMVFDYDHNASNPEQLENTHLPALRKLRAAHPDIPFVLMTRPNQDRGEEDSLQRLAVVEKSYQALLEDGCGPVHLINGQDIFHSHDSEMMTIDGTHPTDFGFYCMAEALEPVLAQYL